MEDTVNEQDLSIVGLNWYGWSYYGFETTKNVARSGPGHFDLNIISPKPDSNTEENPGIYFGSPTHLDQLHKLDDN